LVPIIPVVGIEILRVDPDRCAVVTGYHALIVARFGVNNIVLYVFTRFVDAIGSKQVSGSEAHLNGLDVLEELPIRSKIDIAPCCDVVFIKRPRYHIVHGIAH